MMTLKMFLLLLSFSASYGSPWMTELSNAQKSMPFNFLAIPGTHDSYAFNFSDSLATGVRAVDIPRNLQGMIGKTVSDLSLSKIRVFGSMGFEGKNLGLIYVKRLVRAQQLPLIRQLEIGIRYFHFRMCSDKKVTSGSEEKYKFCHFFMGDSAIPSFKKFFLAYLSANPKEVVILDFAEFHGFGEKDHQEFSKQLNDTFGSLLMPMQKNMNQFSLDTMNKNKKQVIIVYRYSSRPFTSPFGGWFTRFVGSLFWYRPSKLIIQNANTMDTEKAMKYIKNQNNMRHIFPNQFYLIEAVLNVVNQGSTMSSIKTVFPTELKLSEVPGGLYNLTSKLNPQVLAWTRSVSNGNTGVNIISVNFANEDFVNAVLKINKKM